MFELQKKKKNLIGCIPWLNNTKCILMTYFKWHQSNGLEIDQANEIGSDFNFYFFLEKIVLGVYFFK